MIYGYARVSVEDKRGSGDSLSIEAQARAIRAAHPNVVDVLRDDGVSAKVPLLARPSQVGRVLREGDRLVSVRLDRMFRNTRDALETADYLRVHGIAVAFLDLGLDLSLPTGRLTFTMFAALAELERNLISQRTREALAELKAQGRVLGRKPREIPRLDEALAACAAGEPVALVARRLGIPATTLRRRLP